MHCHVPILVLVLTCPELPPLPSPIICLFWPRCAVVGYFWGLPWHTMPCSIFCPCLSLLCLALHAIFRVIGTGCDSASSETDTSRSSLVCRLNHNLSILSLTSFSIHRNGHFPVFQRPQKNLYNWSSEDLISSIKLWTLRHSPADMGVAAGNDGGGTNPRCSEFFQGRPPRNRDF